MVPSYFVPHAVCILKLEQVLAIFEGTCWVQLSRANFYCV